MVRPDPFLSHIARQYQAEQGLSVAPQAHHKAIITESASRAIGDAYDRLPEYDNSAVPAWHAMKEETGRQYDKLTRPRSKGGAGIDIVVSKEDPYGWGDREHDPEYKNWRFEDVMRDAHRDVQENNRMRVYATSETGGHPVFSNDDNDMFRGVHDLFGHMAVGRGIDHNGEEAAYSKHAAMFSPLARQALATETRGQNSALRKHGEFQDQRIGILPRNMQALQFAQTGGRAERVRAGMLAAQKNKVQGL